MYHSSLIQRAEEDETNRRSSNGASQNLGPYNARSPTKTDFPQPVYGTQSPVHSRHSYSNSSYHPSSAQPLPLPLASPTHIHPVSPLNAAPTRSGTAYSSEYQSTPRDKLSGNYYDPTFESRSERRPSDSSVWHNGHPPQVRILFPSREQKINSIRANRIEIHTTDPTRQLSRHNITTANTCLQSTRTLAPGHQYHIRIHRVA